MLLTPMEYLILRFCGRAVTDATMAGGTMLYDLTERRRSGALCRRFGIAEEKLPEILPTTTAAGYLNEETKERTGLTGEVTVAVGAQDQKIAAYGLGLENGTATVSLGTARALEIPCSGRSGELPSFVFDAGDGERYLLEGCINTFGAAIKWLRDQVCAGMSYREMDRMAEGVSAGSGGVRFYPHLSGQSTPHFGKKLPSGWQGITLRTTRAELIHSVYEGLACEIRLNLEAAERAGARVTRLKLFGGGSKSDILCRILCDICGTEITAYDFAEICSFGAAKSVCVCHCRLTGVCREENPPFSVPASEERLYVPIENDSDALYRRYTEGLTV